MAQNISVTGVVLAAGAGTRFGMPKVLADGGAWLRASVAALAGGGCDDVVVVLGAAVVEVPAPARAVVAEDWGVGLSASVRAGVRAAGTTDFVVLTTVDTPGVGAEAVRRVLAAAQESGLARARYDRRPGHPVAIARRHWPALLDTLSGDVGAGPFLNSRDDAVAVDCADLGSGRDIDTR
ncbi:nucleotidyltransferase family protein [Mycobacterium sp. 4D054]|uniref:nucleotidyltransferase family protein n=1 Tax=Mycobacterium sp. 4D054 TaxID=3457440 RepID=UPI003FCEE85B